jgi:hypothetical protein
MRKPEIPLDFFESLELPAFPRLSVTRISIFENYEIDGKRHRTY